MDAEREKNKMHGCVCVCERERERERETEGAHERSEGNREVDATNKTFRR